MAFDLKLIGRLKTTLKNLGKSLAKEIWQAMKSVSQIAERKQFHSSTMLSPWTSFGKELKDMRQTGSCAYLIGK